MSHLAILLIHDTQQEEIWFYRKCNTNYLKKSFIYYIQYAFSAPFP